MNIDTAVEQFREDGFVVVAHHLASDDLAAALDELQAMFPTASGFHDDVDPNRSSFAHRQLASGHT